MSFRLEAAGLVAWRASTQPDARFLRCGDSLLELMRFAPETPDASFVALGAVPWPGAVLAADWRPWPARPDGLLTLALADGAVELLDAAALLAGAPPHLGTAGELPGGAACLAHGSDTRLALGGTALRVLDLAANAPLFDLPAAAPLCSLDWNAVPHVLLAASLAGGVHVLDLRARRESAALGEAAPRVGRPRAFWRPTAPLQLCVAAGAAGAQLWDLRAPRTPLRLFALPAPCRDAVWAADGATLLLADAEGHFERFDAEGVSLRQWSHSPFATSALHFLPHLPDAFAASAENGTLLLVAEPAALARLRPPAPPRPLLLPELAGSIRLLRPRAETPCLQPMPTRSEDRLARLAARLALADASALAAQLTEQPPALLALLSSAGASLAERLPALGIEPERIRRETAAATLEEGDAAAFFAALAADAPATAPAPPRNDDFSLGLEALMRQNVLLGDFEGAVDCALRAGRVHEAFATALAQPSLAPALCARIEAWLRPRCSPATTRFLALLDAPTPAAFAGGAWRDGALLAAGALPSVERPAFLAALLAQLEREGPPSDALLLCAFACPAELPARLAARGTQNLEQLAQALELAMLGALRGDPRPAGAPSAALLHRGCARLVEVGQAPAARRLLATLARPEDGAARRLDAALSWRWPLEGERAPAGRRFTFPARARPPVPSNPFTAANAPLRPPAPATPPKAVAASPAAPAAARPPAVVRPPIARPPPVAPTAPVAPALPAASTPLATRTAPPPPPRVAPPTVYASAKLAEVREFLAKAPGFVADIEPDATRAQQMRHSLAEVERALAARTLAARAFDLLHGLVALVGEDRITEALALADSPAALALPELAPALATIRRFLNAL